MDTKEIELYQDFIKNSFTELSFDHQWLISCFSKLPDSVYLPLFHNILLNCNEVIKKQEKTIKNLLKKKVIINKDISHVFKKSCINIVELSII